MPFNIIFAESTIQVHAKYTCEVGLEHNEDYQWRWVLPYKDPCECSRIRFGGANTDTPKRPFKPVYVEEPLISDNIGEIRDHYGLNCSGKNDVICVLNKFDSIQK